MRLRLFPRSIRWRLLLWLAALLTIVLAGFCMAVSQVHRMSEFQRIDTGLEERLAQMGIAMREAPGPGPRPGRSPRDEDGNHDPLGRGRGYPPRDRENPRGRGQGQDDPRPDSLVPDEVVRMFSESQSDRFYAAIWSRDDVLVYRSPLAPAMLPAPFWSPGPGRYRTRTRGEFREFYYFNKPGNCLLVGQSLALAQIKIDRFDRRLYTAGLLVLVLGLGGGWCLTTREIRPIERISAAARRISEGHLSERIAVRDDGNELGRLAAVLNTTFDRLELAFERQRQFTADASHELRTPLTVMISEAQTTLSKPRSAEEYRETVETCLEEAQRMRRLASSLLELARLDSDRPTSPPERTDLGTLAGGILDHLETSLAAGKGLRFHRDCAPAPLEGHPEALLQVVTNLVSNAIQHTPPGGEVRVATGSEGEEAILTVSDTGEGIEADDLPHIFDRFYRADRARTGTGGHAGLGLAIVKAIVENHRGGIEVESARGRGTTVTVRFPRASAALGAI